MNGSLITVSQLNRYIKSVLESDINLKSVIVSGEISNFKLNSFSGHAYFTLKDENAAVKAVMFKSNAQRLKFLPTDGMNVIVSGSISLYERDGAYQIYVSDIQPDGAGAVALAFEQLKEKLLKEGLFDQAKKKKLPEFPQKIAVITSETGAAVRDILSILSRRWPLATVVMCPVRVQGADAAFEMCDALNRVNFATDCDLIIIGRGGGSIEDLWCFNDEELARTVASSQIPVISAVGHETDFTICDFAADLRAPTPSAAAELAVPDINEMLLTVLGTQQQLSLLIQSKTESLQNRLTALCNRPVFQNKFSTVDSLGQRLDMLKSKMDSAYLKVEATATERLSELLGKLDALNPAKTMLRGFAIAELNGKSVKSVGEIKAGDTLSLRLNDGRAECTVNNTEKV